MNGGFDIGDVLRKVKDRAPLVVQITNFVSASFQASCTLALGGHPIMPVSEKEIGDILLKADSLLINIGTPDDGRIRCMLKALSLANERKIPVVLDPVGCGSSRMRRNLVLELFESGSFNIVKGNHGEILAIYGLSGLSKGVDALSLGNFKGDMRQVVKELSLKYGSVFVSTGELNFVSDGREAFEIGGGERIMSRVTGLGCALGSVMALFLTVLDSLSAALFALHLFSLASRRGYAKGKGPGSFKESFLDELYLLGEGST